MSKKIFTILIIIVVLLNSFSGCHSTTTYSHRLQWWLEDIAWDQNRTHFTGKDIKIAIIDTGINLNDEIKRSVYKCIDLSKNQIDNDQFHGTAMANIIASNPKDSKSVLGIALGSKILSIKINCDSEGNIELEDIIKGIKVAINNQVDIINISIGIQNGNKELENIINTAINSGIIVIAAAGNYIDNDLLYPAAYPNVIAVGSKSKNSEIISPCGDVKTKVIFLPGENIVTAVDDNNYRSVDGTSASCAIMTGIVALMLEKNKNNISPIDFIDSISHLYGKTNLKVSDFLKITY
ncbi:MAG: S8/S53 family peptidase [Clostridia bacterium]|nr:S8/S53 family peptidase [Clostridia bacterium]